ncbi:tetratricopeptide repeat protein [bacterium]|nr:tetratricopeptide repeat protein [bacterium]
MQIKLVEDLLKANPNDVNLHFQRAELLVFLKRFDEAIEETDHLINLNSRLRDAYIVKGRSLAGKKHYREAIRYLDMAFKLGAPSSKLLLEKASYLRNDNKFVEAIEILSRVIKADPSNAAAYESRARCYFNIQGRRKQALQDMEKVVSLHPWDTKAKGAVEALKGELSK